MAHQCVTLLAISLDQNTESTESLYGTMCCIPDALTTHQLAKLVTCGGRGLVKSHNMTVGLTEMNPDQLVLMTVHKSPRRTMRSVCTLNSSCPFAVYRDKSFVRMGSLSLASAAESREVILRLRSTKLTAC